MDMGEVRFRAAESLGPEWDGPIAEYWQRCQLRIDRARRDLKREELEKSLRAKTTDCKA